MEKTVLSSVETGPRVGGTLSPPGGGEHRPHGEGASMSMREAKTDHRGRCVPRNRERRHLECDHGTVVERPPPPAARGAS